MRRIKWLFFLLLLAGFYTEAFCQYQPAIFRGHTNDDLYVRCNDGTDDFLFYFTSDGAVISKQSNNMLYTATLVSETIQGKIIGHNSEYFGESDDYGKTYHMLPPFITDITIIGTYGGEVPGEYLIEGVDPTVFPNSGIVFYKTSDYFASYTFLADSCEYASCKKIEAGSVSGEVYYVNLIDGHAFLSHSLDFGLTSDTISIDTAIINENQGVKFRTLSHGSVQGELYLITWNDLTPSKYHYTVYYSDDYGNSWNKRDSFDSYSDIMVFTAGREACKLYAVDLTTTPGSDYYTLHVYASSNCGLFFEPYSYLLSPDVNVSENEKGVDFVQVTPNPSNSITRVEYAVKKAGRVSLEVCSVVGQKIATINEGFKTPGSYSVSFDTYSLKQGIYTIKLISEQDVVKSSKFVVSK